MIIELASATDTPLVLWVIGFVVFSTTILFKMKSVETPDITEPKK